MPCSKIFSGDLPELTYKVIKNFQNDFPTLHSCILVNRLWCRLAIPILWNNPFSNTTKNLDFIEIYLDNLNDDLKTRLNEYDEFAIINNSSPSLFNYPSFLKYLNIEQFIYQVEGYFAFNASTLAGTTRCSLVSRDMFAGTLKRLKKDICIPLFKIFIENEIKLNTLEIEVTDLSKDGIHFNNILELILQNPSFIYNIKNLKLYGIYDNGKTHKDHILQIIKLHQNLKNITLNHDYLPLFQSLILSKNYNCSNTLNTIVFFQVNFNGIIIDLDKIFQQLNVLESVHIVYCYLNNSFNQQIINITKPFKLKTLIMDKLPEIESLQSLLQKSGSYLENFECENNYVNPSLENRVLELITKYCINIKFFKFFGMGINKVFNLIESIKQNLNYLIIMVSTKDSSNILQNLGQVLPSKLEHLSLSLFIKESDFKTFLENFQVIFVNKLLIKQKGSYDILYYIKEYIMKEKRVKYLGIRNFEDRVDLSSLKDEVKEFMLHNIIVQNHKILSLTDVDYDLVKEIDYLLYKDNNI